MFQYIANAGLVGYVILLLGIVCVVKLVRALSGSIDRSSARGGLLFFGVLAVLLGFLGHTVGIFTALGVILEAEVIDPELVKEALWISLSTVFLGFGVLAVACLGWLVLGLGGRGGSEGTGVAAP